jgi:carbamoyltransferase
VTKDVIILGIHDGHNAGAALIKNGSVVAAIQEERLNNKKNFSGTPVLSISKVFDIGKIVPSDVNLIAIAGLIKTHAPLKERPLHVALYERYARLFSSHTMTSVLVKSLHKKREMIELNSIFRDLFADTKEIMFIEHHTGHAACAYYQRPWTDDTLVLTLDGAGDGLCSSVNIGSNFSLDRIASTTSYNSPGNIFYSEITGYLGLKRWEHEYKVMGMAPYGIPEYCLDKIQKIVRVNPDKPLEFENTIGAYMQHVQKKLSKLLPEQRFDNISAATQQHYENIVTQWVQNTIDFTGVHKIACAGGMFLNVKANKLIREMESVDDVFFYPAASDEGIPVGAALEGYYRFCEREGIKAQKEILGPIYYGMEYSNNEIESVLKKTGWIEKAHFFDEIDHEVGERIAKGSIVARFNGRVEWGPRGLGNRSILADPRDLRVIRKINFAIKHRDFWMPFAASILDERKSDYLINARESPYMIEAFDTTSKSEELLAGLHPKDMTCRPQTVNSWDSGYRDVLKTFEDISGIGGVLNTSFNLHGYPLVGTPEIAIHTLNNSDLDTLAIGNWMIEKC